MLLTLLYAGEGKIKIGLSFYFIFGVRFGRRKIDIFLILIFLPVLILTDLILVNSKFKICEP